MKRICCLLIISFLFSVQACSSSESKSTGQVVPGIPVKNTVTFVDLGAKTCIPCKMMAPILDELKKEYQGRAEILFIDVWDESNKGKALAFKVSAIPTQVFFNKRGEEVYRHVGFLDKESIVSQLEALLAQN